jgi:hypothetical protein
MHPTHSPSQRSASPALGLRIARPAQPAIAWLPWQVVDRERGFHVSREAASGQHIAQALTNEVGKTKIFRKRELAQAACDSANGTGVTA